MSAYHVPLQTYADPLRSNSLDETKSITILEPADSLALFGNIDEIVPLNEALIADVWALSSGLGDSGSGVGDVVLKHVRSLHSLESRNLD